MDKVTLSMQHLPPRDRFAYWREERMQPIIGLTGERDNAGDFAAHLTASISAPLKRIRTRTEGFTAARGTKEIARVGWQDRICLYGQVHGRQQFEQRGREPAPDDLVEERFRNDRTPIGSAARSAAICRGSGSASISSANRLAQHSRIDATAI